MRGTPQIPAFSRLGGGPTVGGVGQKKSSGRGGRWHFAKPHFNTALDHWPPGRVSCKWPLDDILLWNGSDLGRGQAILPRGSCPDGRFQPRAHGNPCFGGPIRAGPGRGQAQFPCFGGQIRAWKLPRWSISASGPRESVLWRALSSIWRLGTHDLCSFSFGQIHEVSFYGPNSPAV